VSSKLDSFESQYSTSPKDLNVNNRPDA